jgi:hypothetical protein
VARLHTASCIDGSRSSFETNTKIVVFSENIGQKIEAM